MEQLVTWVDYIGVMVFAITGCFVAARNRLDIISFILLAGVTGLGGGTLRDVLLDRTVFWIAKPGFLIDCALTGIVMFFVAQKIEEYRKWIIWGDAIGIAVFTVTGTRIALETGASWPVCITMGVMTSIVGGIIRDLLANEPSLIVHKEIYATACVFGAGVFMAAQAYAPDLAVPLGILSTFALRAAAITWRLTLPGYDYVPGEHRRKADG